MTTLLEYGYDDAHRTDLPLIVRFASAAEVTPMAVAAATVLSHPRSSVADATVLESKKDAAAFVDTVTSSGAGVPRMWLNGRRRLTLDRSVAQIGAPAAGSKPGAGHDPIPNGILQPAPGLLLESQDAVM